MADLKNLREMAKNGEISKEILEDENLKSELKKILKEENGVDVTDEQLPELLKGLEEGLTSDGSEKGLIGDPKDLENVSGGSVGRSVAKGVLGTGGFIAGAILGGLGTQQISKKAFSEYKQYTDDINAVKDDKSLSPEDRFDKVLGLAVEYSHDNPTQSNIVTGGNLAGGAVGGTLGAIGGVKFANFICDKIGNRKKRK